MTSTRAMARRLRVRGWLRTESPLHVGGLGDDQAETLPIALDGLGRVYVPGTSLAGVLRSWLRGVSTDPDVLGDLWGIAAEQGDEGRASRVIVADALVTAETRLDEHGLPATPLDPARLEYRHSVGIDRVTGAAAPEFLHGRAVVPAGCYLRLEIDVESHTDAESALDKARMSALLAALTAGEIRIGAATSRGLGSVRLLDDPLELLVDRFDSPDGLLAVLRDDPARRSAALRRTDSTLRGAELPPRRDWLEVRVTWRPLAPVMGRGTTDGLVIGTLPLTGRVDRRHLTLVVPGASLKGVLRGHAEFIERTARSAGPAPAPATPTPAPGRAVADYSTAFRAQLDQLPAVRALFGAIRVEECTAEVTVPEELWRAVTGSADTPREAMLGWLEDLGMAQSDHVALDRWTGGAAAGRLFSVLEPHAVQWEPIRLAVDLTRLDGDQDHALALLLLTLRDLAAGRIPIGALVNRGFGDIEVTEVALTGKPWEEPLTLTQALTAPQTARITAAWTDYLAQEVS